MKKEKINRSRIVGLRFTATEFEKLSTICSNTTTPHLSECIRRRLFDRPLVTFTRNQSMDEMMQEMISTRQHLQAIGNNINQAVKLMHTHQHDAAVKEFLTAFGSDRDRLFALIEKVKAILSQYADLWLQ